MNIAALYRNYAAHDDPLVAASNSISLFVAASQPFYPIYVWWIAGADAWPTLFTLLSTPFFLAVPAMARANTIFGRALLPVAGIANTAVTAALLGPATGVLLFLGPVMMIAMLQFRREERWWGLSISALAGAVYLALDALAPAGLVAIAPAEAARLVTLHAISAASLIVICGMQFGPGGRAAASPGETVGD